MIKIYSIREHEREESISDKLEKIGELQLLARLIEFFSNKKNRKGTVNDLKRLANKELVKHKKKGK